MSLRHSSAVPVRNSIPSTIVAAHHKPNARIRPCLMACSAKKMVRLLESRQMVLKTRDLENLRRWAIDASADVVHVGGNKDRRRCRLADDEREHAHPAARRQTPVFVCEYWNGTHRSYFQSGSLRVLYVPKRAAATNHRIFSEVVSRRWRRRRPLQRPCIPWIASGHFAVQVGVESGSSKDQDRNSLDQAAH